MGVASNNKDRPGLRLVEAGPHLQPLHFRPLHPSSNGAGLGPILYVSGANENRILFTRMSRRWKPLRLLVVDGTQAGLGLSNARHFCLIVLNASLPDVDAVDLVIHLRKARKSLTVPIMVLSDDTSPQTRARFMWVGANAVVTMPFDAAEVERTVQHLLHSVPLA